MPWHLYLMAAMYIIAGCMHFIKPKAYLAIMPAYFPAPRAMVFLSGIAEIVLGIALCFQATKNLAIYGIIIMLLLFMTVHIDMLTNPRIKGKVPMWFIWLRLPLQFGLIYWAYFYLSL